jgi:hypothetical protein
MEKLVTRISRAAIMGLAWAGVWVAVGLLPARLIVGELEPEHIGGPLYAGFICGAVFSELAGIASGRRRLDELSSSQAAVWGAASGLFVGVLPFVLGDNGAYQAGWTLAIVATSATAAGIAAGRRRLGEWSSFRAATLVAVVSGLLAGALPWFLTTQHSIERFLPVAVIGGLSLLSALSACVSQSVSRWLTKQNSPASATSL